MDTPPHGSRPHDHLVSEPLLGDVHPPSVSFKCGGSGGAYGAQVPFTQLARELVQSTQVPPVLPHAVSAVPGWQVPFCAAEQQPPLHGVSFGRLHSVVQM